MPWLDLHRGILEEFASRAATLEASLQVLRSRCDNDYQRIGSHVSVRGPRDDVSRAARAAQKRLRLRRRRLAEAAKRPPCPQCGAVVVRLGTTGTLPKYCSWRCMQTAKVLRFKARHAKEAA